MQVHKNIGYNIKNVEPTKTNVNYHYLSLLCVSKAISKYFLLQNTKKKVVFN